jgi:hypothetical protein
VVVVAIVIPYLISSRRNRKFGGHGFVQHSRLTCPKCQGVFDYNWIPGGALTAVRLGTARYMACPLCHRWSVFNTWDARPPPGPPAS